MDHIEFARLGAKARNKKLTKKQRSAAARHAVTVRWARVRAAALKVAKQKNGKRPAVNGNRAKRK